jgi:uncharacterized protein YqeY
MKHIESILDTTTGDNFDLMQKIKKEIELIKQYYDNDQINATTKDIFLN